MKTQKKLKILIVAMSDSIHTTRWINQIVDQGWDIHLFPCVDHGVSHPELRNITVHHNYYSKQENLGRNLKIKGINVNRPFIKTVLLTLKKKFARFDNYHSHQLAALIKKLKPDIVHSLEFSLAGYLTMEAKKILKDEPFPKWIATNWGSDIYLFGQLKVHQPKIEEVLSNCDYYSCECHRDVYLAKEMGLKGQVLPVFPNTGGFNLDEVKKYRLRGKISSRKMITLKGYQNWAGRALVGLRALARCADLLKGYTIAIFSAGKDSDVAVAAEIFTRKTNIPTHIIGITSHKDILKYHGQSRISLGVSISDAISTSLLEAMVMGSFPIQSNTACANEWIKDGKSGILVPPEDPDIIEKALRKALKDDNLVDQAAKINWQTAKAKLQKEQLKKQIVDFYLQVNHEVQKEKFEKSIK